MQGFFTSIHVYTYVGLFFFLVIWLSLYACAHLLVSMLRRDKLLGWAVGPFGVTIMSLHEPSLLSLWLNVLCPALVSGGVLYAGLLSPLSPVSFPQAPLPQFLLLTCGVLFTSTTDLVTAVRDLRYPLWGEARVLRNIQNLRASWARIHFTAFGQSYLHDHFGSNPTDLLQAF